MAKFANGYRKLTRGGSVIAASVLVDGSDLRAGSGYCKLQYASLMRTLPGPRTLRLSVTWGLNSRLAFGIVFQSFGSEGFSLNIV